MNNERLIFSKLETQNPTQNIKKALFASAILLNLIVSGGSANAESKTESSTALAGSSVNLGVEVMPMIRCNQDFSECLTNESCATGYDSAIKKYTDTDFCKIDVIKDESTNTVTILDNLDNVHIDSSTPFLRK
jgi:hypothetical protein